jgi:tetratricopeptide (TPR) repeat protein
VDQHSNRLTLTQSTYKAAVEDSAPAQLRLANVHSIVYPPRWAVKEDLALRYASLGVYTSAAELYESLHLWDEVVECYKAAGKNAKAEEIIRRELEERPTARMWAALADITNEEAHYVKSWELSGCKYARAKAALGRLAFDKGKLREAYDHLHEALAVKPLTPQAWFLLGNVSMRLGEYDTGKVAFSNVVQQVPDEGDAWANLAAIHIHMKEPAQAYPALLESLKYARHNWRVWINKMFVCMDLAK